jgi:RNA polymerase sigma-B factor
MAMPAKKSDNGYPDHTPLFLALVDETTPAQRRRELRDLLVSHHLSVAEHIAQRFRNRGQPAEDLKQVARLGLVLAVDRFDPTRGHDFLSFAVPTITGEIRRYFRDSTWAMHVPRRLKELHSAIKTTSAALNQELGRPARPSELAAELQLPVEEIYEGLQVAFAYAPGSLDQPSITAAGDPIARQTGQLDDALSMVEDRQSLYPALAALSDRDASVVIMRFFGNLSQTQIAARVGVSQMQVSRILTRTLDRLRRTLADA